MLSFMTHEILCSCLSHSHICVALYSSLACQHVFGTACATPMPLQLLSSSHTLCLLSRGCRYGCSLCSLHMARLFMTTNSHIAMQVVHEFSDAKDLLQLSSHSFGVGQAQQAQQAAAEQLAGVSNLTVSSTGRWAAVVKGSHVHVIDLEAMSYHGRLPALQVGLSAPFCHLAVILCIVSCPFYTRDRYWCKGHRVGKFDDAWAPGESVNVFAVVCMSLSFNSSPRLGARTQ